MNERETLLVLTLCELICPEKNVEPKEVQRAYQEAKRKLDADRQPPPEGYISRAPRR